MRKIAPIEDENNQTVSKDEIRRDAKIEFQRYSSQKESFHHIEKSCLFLEQEVHFSIFAHKGLKFQPVIEASEKSPVKITPEILSDLEADFVIKHSDMPLFKEYLDSLFNKLLLDKGEQRIKSVLMKEKTKIVIRDILLNPRSGEHIKQAEFAVENMSSAILNNENIIYELISIKNHDYYTYTHSANVEVLCIGFGVYLGLSKAEIFNLGLGAMLHDIGKSLIPAEILNKQGKLTKSEFLIIQNHVIEGEKILKLHNNFPEESFPATTQHHEKLSGNGYPQGLNASEIKLFGKITAIADCYDALTTERPYKEALTPFNALNIIVKETDNYDNQLLKLFIKMLGRISSQKSN